MRKLLFLAVALSLASAIPCAAQTQPGAPEGLRYRSGWGTMVKLGKDLHGSLKREFRPAVHVYPINIETDVTPFVRLEVLDYPDLPRPMACVFISAGFIDLVNNVAHAKAIDKIERNYFKKYILSLSKETGEKELHELPNLSNKKYWTEEMLNEQLSNFNQIVGEVVGIKLAHYYLGHYKKYADKLTDEKGKPVPINTLLTEDEWEQAVRYGVRNALDCGLGIDGVKALYDCIDEMPVRPDWTEFFLPKKVKVRSLKRSLDKIEKAFFAGEEI